MSINNITLNTQNSLIFLPNSFILDQTTTSQQVYKLLNLTQQVQVKRVEVGNEI